MLRPLGELTAPVILTLHHEPENDAGPAGMQPSDFVAMQRRLIELAADLAPQVVVAPGPAALDLRPHPRRHRPGGLDRPGGARRWASTSTTRGRRTNGKPWRSFGSKVDEVLGWFGDTPLVIGEYGCREDPANPGLAAEWLRDAAEYARTHNIVSMSYFNSDLNAPDGSWELSGGAEQAFAELLASDWVARTA